jgi:hypothetical protein
MANGKIEDNEGFSLVGEASLPLYVKGCPPDDCELMTRAGYVPINLSQVMERRLSLQDESESVGYMWNSRSISTGDMIVFGRDDDVVIIRDSDILLNIEPLSFKYKSQGPRSFGFGRRVSGSKMSLQKFLKSLEYEELCSERQSYLRDDKKELKKAQQNRYLNESERSRLLSETGLMVPAELPAGEERTWFHTFPVSHMEEWRVMKGNPNNLHLTLEDFSKTQGYYTGEGKVSEGTTKIYTHIVDFLTRGDVDLQEQYARLKGKRGRSKVDPKEVRALELDLQIPEQAREMQRPFAIPLGLSEISQSRIGIEPYESFQNYLVWKNPMVEKFIP